MRKARNKKVSLVITIVFMLTLLVPFVSPVAAAADMYALTTPSVTTGLDRTLGTLRIVETEATAGSIGAGTQIEVILPAGVAYMAAPTAAAVANYVSIPATVGSIGNTLAAADVSINPVSSTKKLVLDIAAPTGAGTRAIIDVLFNVTNVSRADVSTTGDILIQVLSNNGSVTASQVLVAKGVSAGTTIAALSAPTRSEGNNRAIGQIDVRENATGALAASVAAPWEAIEFTLPDGVTWNTVPTANINASGITVAVDPTDPSANAKGLDRVRYRVTAPATLFPGVISFTGGTVNIDSTVEDGEIVMTVGGSNSGITPATVVIAKKGSFGVTTSAADPEEIYAGRDGSDIAKITIKESIATSLVGGRTVTIELPTGVAWDTVPVPVTISGNALLTGGAIVANTNNRKVSYNVTAGTTASTIELRSGAIDVEADVEADDVVAVVAGTAGAAGEVNIAKIITPVTASSDSKDVIIGVQNQAAGDVVITEAGAGVLLARPFNTTGNVEVWCPAGVTFAATPKVSVTEGNLVIDNANVRRANNNSRLIIPLRTSSSKASKITISDIKLTVNRDVPEGTVRLAIGGNAIDMVNNPAAGAANVVAATVVAAQVITPAPGETSKSVSFTAGQSGVYIENGRTMVQVNMLDELGITKAWDAASKTAYFFNGAKVVSFPIGEARVNVQGVANITLEAANKIIDGNTYVALRGLEYLGVSLGWDDATKTATASLK